MIETLFRSIGRRNERDPEVIHFDFAAAGDFKRAEWCNTHADWIGHMVPFDGRRCRWALKVDGSKPCADVVWRLWEVKQ